MFWSKGKTAEEDTKLQAASDAPAPDAGAPETHQTPWGNGRWLRVEVTDLQGGQRKVNVRVPFGLVDFGLKMGAKFGSADLGGLDAETIIAAMKSGGTGKIVDVEDEEEGKHVEIYVE